MKFIIKPLSILLAWTIFTATFPVRVFSQKAEKLNVAVLNLEGFGISAMEAATLTDRLRSELVGVGVFLVVERGQMEMILEEQGFQQTGCTSAECAVEVGKLLGVQKMITGSIGKIGKLFTVDVRMFDVVSSGIEQVSKRDHRGEVEGLLGLLEVVAKDLAGIKEMEEVAQVVIEAPEKEEVVEVAEEAKPVKKKRWFLWTTLAAAVGGGAYYYYMTMLEEEQKDLPGPPAPPN
ncbi:MAG: hypothetical protein H8E82_07785 [Candidatus Marinimicrobia bacterium]|nr:hypothetical protein [Candidatus Neomarinimicrobiota bacterium]